MIIRAGGEVIIILVYDFSCTDVPPVYLRGEQIKKI